MRISTRKALALLGIFLLLGMAGLHGSGFFLVKGAIEESNASGFIKSIVPVLFAHPSIHLLGMAAFGILGWFQPVVAKPIWGVLAGIVLADALLAFILGGWLAGGLLAAAAGCFIVAGQVRDEAA